MCENNLPSLYPCPQISNRVTENTSLSPNTPDILEIPKKTCYKDRASVDTGQKI